ncbi:Uncharacterised protein [Vibrio cholerae]|nr:Uncharacterised protein [Vibrio cholerae]CSB82184.1 Uncharacterised protein [Vibrio cholerae]
MQHKGIVKAFMVAVTLLAFDVVIFLVNLRSLRETCLLFMHGLSDDDARIFRL